MISIPGLINLIRLYWIFSENPCTKPHRPLTGRIPTTTTTTTTTTRYVGCERVITFGPRIFLKNRTTSIQFSFWYKDYH